MTVRFLYYLYFVTAISACIFAFPNGFSAVLLSAIIAILTIAILKNIEGKSEDLLKIFLVALVLRTAISTTIHMLGITEFFALDWYFYDGVGKDMSDYWLRNGPVTANLIDGGVFDIRGTAWGMGLFVGVVYSIAGHNMLAGQLVIAAIGAAAAPVAYLCSYQMYRNRRVALISGYIIAAFPSLVLWSSLLLKDGLIIFFLIFTIYTSLKLQDKLEFKDIIILLISLLGLLSLRFYVFYISIIAISAGFIIGQQNTVPAVIRRVVVVTVIAIGIIYGGFLHNASQDVGEISSLKRIQQSRSDLANSAASGFGKDLDVSTTEGAAQALPIGLVYLLLAPFPWQITSNLSLITMPEMVVWWISIPFIFIGVKYSLRYRLKQCISMIIFSLMLMLSYAILQGNVGTAYRTRAQIQVFLFMFIAVGLSLSIEKKENQKALRLAMKQKQIKRL